MLVFIFGVYAFTFGSVRLPWKLSISGWRARVSGIFLIAPLLILFLLGRVISQGVDRQTALSFYGFMESVIVLLGILGAVLFSYLTRPKDEEINQGED